MNNYLFALSTAVIGLLSYIWFRVMKRYGGYN